jgi:sterol desaturase/sphingolipid hydroxylase (fatty acid hydroxylase superfamily)
MLLPFVAHVAFVCCLTKLTDLQWRVESMFWIVEGYNVVLLLVCSHVLPVLSRNKWLGVRRVPDAPPECAETGHQPFFRYFVQTNLLIALLFYALPLSHHSCGFRSHALLWYMVELMWNVLKCYFVFEILETSLHRVLHHRYVFRRIHYLHHQSSATQSISGFYMTAPDAVLQICVPTFVPLLLFSKGAEITVTFLLLGLFYIHTGHSGYEMSHMFSGEYHFLHHLKPSMHYSAIDALVEQAANYIFFPHSTCSKNSNDS